ncbi:partial Sporulation initiation phosphotransferase F, partial [Anaerolineae bacterium]
FSLILEDAGFEVQEAEGGLKGIELVKQHRPDLIFLDLRMPEIDGVETLRRLKQIDDGLNVYIVTAFANEYMDQLKVAHNEGLHFQIASKPLSSTQIKHIVGSISDSKPHQHKLSLTLYIVSLNTEFQEFIERLKSVLSASYQPDEWHLDVVEVLHMPEKALANDVFATPMLVRELPEPVLHVLGDLSKMSSIIAAITSQHDNESDTIVV